MTRSLEERIFNLLDVNRRAPAPLRSPVTVVALNALKHFDIDQSLRALYTFADGCKEGASVFNFFRFLPAAEASALAARTLDATSGQKGCPITVDPALRNDLWWRPHWLPLFMDDTGGFVADFDPSPAGTRGQIFSFGYWGGSPRVVLARSTQDLLLKLGYLLHTGKFSNEDGEIYFEEKDILAAPATLPEGPRELGHPTKSAPKKAAPKKPAAKAAAKVRAEKK